MPTPLRVLYDPPRFQSAHRRDAYFEGWYFKCVDAAAEHAIAIIPGISRDPDGGTSHSFVQLIRPGGRTYYAEYPVDAFSWSADRFEVAVGPNRFSRSGLVLDLLASPGAVTDEADPHTAGEAVHVRGEVVFGQWAPWPVRPWSPGVMGWYRFVPRMECYHGVLSMDHTLEGALDVGGERLFFGGGRGYAEKDWGTSFPSSWIWVQSNHFRRPHVGVMVSVARIPWLGSHFVGHVGGLLLDGDLVRFATYTGARLCALDSTADGVTLTLRDRRRELELHVAGTLKGALRAPEQGRMSGRADEALDASVHVILRELRGGRAGVRFDGVGRHAGVETMNERGELTAEACG